MSPLMLTQSGSNFVSAGIHGVGLLASIYGLGLSVRKIQRREKPRAIIACLVFSTVMGFMYSASVAYHITSAMHRTGALLLDQAAILVMIGGTALAYEVLAKRPGTTCSPISRKVTLLRRILISFGTLIAVVCQIIFQTDQMAFVAIASSFGIVVSTLSAFRPCPGFRWVVVGGIIYLAGVPFLAASEEVPLAHPVWHVFVLVGNGCHYQALRSASSNRRRRKLEPISLEAVAMA